MKCDDVFKLISDYIDRELKRDIEEIIEEHIRECERCFALMKTLEKTIFLSKSIYKRRRKVPKKVLEKVYYEVRIRYRKNETFPPIYSSNIMEKKKRKEVMKNGKAGKMGSFQRTLRYKR